MHGHFRIQDKNMWSASRAESLTKPRRVHLVAARNVMRYLKDTIDFGLYYVGDHDYRLYGYTYVD